MNIQPDCQNRLQQLGTRHLLQLGNRKIEYFFAPKTGEPLVVLLPALGRSVDEFAELAGFLQANQYQTLSVQTRGAGNSRAPAWPPTTLDDLVDDVAAVLDFIANKPPAIHLLGRALGNRIARAFASKFPNQVESLVLMGVGGRVRPKGRVVRKYLSAALLRSGRGLSDLLCAPGNTIPKHLCQPIPWRAVLQQLPAIRPPRDPDWWLAGGRPMLVLQGACDQIAPIENGHQLAAAMPATVELHDIPNAGHLLVTEQFEVVSELTLAHLNSFRRTDFGDSERDGC